jgi:hypothetical protein
MHSSGGLLAAPGQLEAVETRVAPDIKGRAAGQILGDVGEHVLPLVPGKIAERVIRRRLHAPRQVQVVEPGPQRGNLALHLGPRIQQVALHGMRRFRQHP